MKEYTMSSRKSHVLRFWIVTLICAVMIGTACWFAYTQTANELTVQLETTVGRIQDMPATNPPYTKPAKTPAAVIKPTETDPPEMTEDETIAVAAVPVTEEMTETAQTETVTESTTALCKPVEGTVIQPFSGETLVKSETTGVWQTHNGTDYAASLGDSVCAVQKGVVTRIEEDALWGITVTIDHKNGVLTRSCGLNTGLSVAEGDAVEAGTVIGAVGNTADIESGIASHLHFEVIKNGDFIDPERYLP